MVNKVILIGNVGANIDVRDVAGSKVGKFTLATSEKFQVNDSWKEVTYWHTIECWGAIGEKVAKYITQGKQVYVEGSLRYEEYTDKVTGKKCKVAKINARDIRLLGPKPTENVSAPTPIPQVPSYDYHDDEPVF